MRSKVEPSDRWSDSMGQATGEHIACRRYRLSAGWRSISSRTYLGAGDPKDSILS